MDVSDIKTLIANDKNIDYEKMVARDNYGVIFNYLNYLILPAKNESCAIILIFDIVKRKNYKEIFNGTHKSHYTRITNILALKGYFNALKIAVKFGAIITSETLLHSLYLL
jgi:hypothetical protein